MLIDSHCHLHDREFFSETEAEAALDRARKRNVQKIICIGTSHRDSLAARDFAATHDDVYWTYGIHPNESKKTTKNIAEGELERDFFRADVVATRRPEVVRVQRGGRHGGDAPYTSAIASRCTQKACPQFSKPIAIGEVGLDYHYEGYDREAQIKLFEQMLQLALDNDLPLSFHVREAFGDFFPIVSNFPTVRGVVHSFTDSKKTLKRILNETDFYVGVNGLATYSTLPTPPIERILLETDAPFLAPMPFRGATNEPAYIYNIAEWLSKKMELDLGAVERTTTQNAKKLFWSQK